MMKLNSKLIDDPVSAREALMSVTAALYTGIGKDAPMSEAAEVAGICAAMWKVCDALNGLCGGVEA